MVSEVNPVVLMKFFKISNRLTKTVGVFKLSELTAYH